MNTPQQSSSSWDELLARARRDRVPAPDPRDVLRALHREGPPQPTWQGEFLALFDRRSFVPGCFSASALVLAVAMWTAWFQWDLIAPVVETVLGVIALPAGGGVS